MIVSKELRLFSGGPIDGQVKPWPMSTFVWTDADGRRWIYRDSGDVDADGRRIYRLAADEA